jgi:hypothetical protein
MPRRSTPGPWCVARTGFPAGVASARRAGLEALAGRVDEVLPLTALIHHVGVPVGGGEDELAAPVPVKVGGGDVAHRVPEVELPNDPVGHAGPAEW